MIRKRGGRPSEIIRLDIHDGWGRLQTRIKGKVTEKNIGCSIINKVEDICNINKVDIDDWRKEMRQRELKDFADMEEQARKQKSIIVSKIKFNK